MLLYSVTFFFSFRFTPCLVTSLLLHNGNGFGGVFRLRFSFFLFLSFFLSPPAMMIVCVHLRSLVFFFFFFFLSLDRCPLGVQCFFFLLRLYTFSFSVRLISFRCMYVCVPTVEYYTSLYKRTIYILRVPPEEEEELSEAEAEDEEAKHAHTHTHTHTHTHRRARACGRRAYI